MVRKTRTLAQETGEIQLNLEDLIRNLKAFCDEFCSDELADTIKSLQASTEKYKKAIADQSLSKAEEEIKKYEESLKENERQRQQTREQVTAESSASLNETSGQTDIIDLPFDVFGSSDILASDVTPVATVEDGLIACLNAKGRVDINYIAAAAGCSAKEVIYKLRGVIYQNPARFDGSDFTSGFEMAEEYLSGNLVKKYKQAEEANKKYNGLFKANVDALLSLLPKYLSTDEIYITLGSPFVPEDIIDDFIDYISDTKRPNRCSSIYKTRHDHFTGIWEIPCKTRFRHSKAAVRNSVTYGTPKMEMLYLLEATLNMRTPNIKKEIVSPKEKNKTIFVTDEKETMLAIEKQDLLIKTFQEWVWQDKARTERIREIYDETYVGIKKRTYNGSFLTFPGMNKDVQLYPYQKNAVARILQSPATLLAHDVGSGKTLVMISAGMELRRMGISKKNLYVVPNNIVGQWQDMFMLMYPDANLLIVDPKSFTKEKRKTVLKNIARKDYDGIIMAYSCFDQLPLSEKYYKEYYKEQTDNLIEARKVFYSDAPIDRKIKSINETLKKIHEKQRLGNDYGLSFDDLHINTLFLDEAHNYKNVPIETKVSFNRSVNAAGSNKCKLMMDRVRCVQTQNGGRGVVFATGTPITNSVTDLFVMQKYLQSGELSLLGIQNFDAWIGMFSEKTTSYEIDVDTNSYHLVTRFSNFHNLPELTAILSSIADFHQVDKENGIPELDGYTDTTLEGGLEFKNYLKTISERAEAVRTRQVSREEDNLLKITTDGRKAALDMRLIDEKEYKYQVNTKTESCANNIYKLYKETANAKAAQLVFCDSSVPKDGFNIYDELKSLLVVKGVPAKEIAYIHDATTEKKREKLFKDVREGKIRVLIGSTFKLGLGVNVQDKLIALHHLDCPWRPADMVQREGRILRQGNENEKVQIFRYITKGSFDAYSWQLLETKQRFISQLLAGSLTERESSDVNDTVLDYAEVKALAVGNPLIKRRCEVSNELDKTRILQRSYNENRAKLVSEKGLIPEKIKHEKDLIALCELDKEVYAANKREYPYEEAKALREKIAKAVNANFERTEETFITTYQGFKISVPSYMRRPDGKLLIEGNGRYYLEIGSESGITIRLNNFFENFDEKIKEYKDAIKALRQRKAAIEEELSHDESHEDEIERLTKKLAKIDKELGLKK